MKFIKIKNNIINLEEVSHIYTYFDRLVVVFKNGTNTEIPFADCDKRDAEFNYIWLALTNMNE